MAEQPPRHPGPARAVVSADHVHLVDEPVHVGAPRPESHHGEPKIQLVREDGLIRAIDVICSCGERIRIRCEYD